MNRRETNKWRPLKLCATCDEATCHIYLDPRACHLSYRHQLDDREIVSKLHANFWDNPVDDDRSKWEVGLGGGKHKETEGSDVDEGCFTRDFGIRPFERNLGTQRSGSFLRYFEKT